MFHGEISNNYILKSKYGVLSNDICSIIREIFIHNMKKLYL